MLRSNDRRLSPAIAVRVQKVFQLLEKLEQPLRVSILNVTGVVRVLGKRQDINFQITAHRVGESFQHQVLGLPYRELPYALQAYVEVVHEQGYVLVVLAIYYVHLFYLYIFSSI